MVANPRNIDEANSMHGIPMTEEAFEHLINLESPYRYELIDGLVYDMTGSTPEHADIADNISKTFKDQIGRQGPCRVYQEQYVLIPGKPSVVPNVVVTCDLGDRDKTQRLEPFKIRSPLIVVEVLSPSTMTYDRTEKFARYMLCPTLEVYILAHRDEQYIEVYRKATGWKQERYVSGETAKLDQLDLELPLASVYEGVF